MGSSPHRAIKCDVCIVGAGPAGLALAQALDHAGVTAVVLERGNASASDVPPPMAVVSDPELGDLSTSRAAALGGTATIWNTIREGEPGAKYVALDPIDFESRAITPHGGWPIDGPSLAPWYREAGRLLGLSDLPLPTNMTFAFPPDGLTSNRYQWGPATLFTQHIPTQLRASERSTLLPATRVTRLLPTHAGDGIRAVEWCNTDGAPGVVFASHVVLAGGAIENARMLMVFAQRQGRTPPEWLGRGFMEHPIDRSLTLHTRHPAASPVPGFYDFRGTTIGRISPSADLMRAHDLRNASLRLFVKRHRRPMRLLRNAAHMIGRTPFTTYHVLLDLEQAPHPDNRLVLTGRIDAFGVPEVQLHWAWRPEDDEFRRRLIPVLANEFHRSDAGTLTVGPIPPVDANVHHHAGSTRMHENPEGGVVNADLRVHGMENLYIVGSSTFPSSGAANPTLTILALSLRLAGHLNRP